MGGLSGWAGGGGLSGEAGGLSGGAVGLSDGAVLVLWFHSSC